MKRLILFMVLIITVCATAVYLLVNRDETPPASDTIITDASTVIPTTSPPTEPIIEATDLITDPITEPVTEPVTEFVKTYDIPLSAELQAYTISVCREYEIDHLIVFAMMEAESLYTIDIVGDNGNAIGILQVQPRYHQARADKLGVSIYDVKGNILVAIDLLNELLDKYGDYGLAVTAYNRGTATEISAYGTKVLNIASTIERIK